jgi:hypothetical protein
MRSPPQGTAGAKSADCRFVNSTGPGLLRQAGGDAVKRDSAETLGETDRHQFAARTRIILRSLSLDNHFIIRRSSGRPPKFNSTFSTRRLLRNTRRPLATSRTRLYIRPRKNLAGPR